MIGSCKSSGKTAMSASPLILVQVDLQPRIPMSSISSWQKTMSPSASLWPQEQEACCSFHCSWWRWLATFSHIYRKAACQLKATIWQDLDQAVVSRADEPHYAGIMIGIPLDATSSKWDVSTTAGIKHLNQDLRKEDPYCLVLTQPCGPWGNWRRFNLTRGGKAAETVLHQQQEGRKICKNVNEIAFHRLRIKRHVFLGTTSRFPMAWKTRKSRRWKHNQVRFPNCFSPFLQPGLRDSCFERMDYLGQQCFNCIPSVPRHEQTFDPEASTTSSAFLSTVCWELRDPSTGSWKKLFKTLKAHGWIMSRIERTLFYLAVGGELRGILITRVDGLFCAGEGP